ncbi:MAG TPA: OmpA family protein [Kofleriaceae bacterium]|nr:OmpA family protein [Kofleriaceae bacterium]
MKSTIPAILFSALIANASIAPPADACGVKLTVKGSPHRKGIARTSNPSDVLLLGNPPRRLSRDLSTAGHRVEVAPTPAAAKRKTYAVVITENQQADEARQKFPEAVVMVRSGDITADMRSVEKQVARKPVAADQGRAVVAARTERPPIAAGPIQPRREIVTAAEPTEPAASPQPEAKPVAARPSPAPTVATEKPTEKATEKKAAPEVAAVTPAPTHPAVTPKTVSRSGSEVYFSTGIATADESELKNVIKWLTDNPDVQVTVEGHADPTGNPDDNMTLSERRANWVRDTLVAGGVDSSRIEVKPYGQTHLKYGATDRRNRRAAVVAK